MRGPWVDLTPGEFQGLAVLGSWALFNVLLLLTAVLAYWLWRNRRR